LHSANNTAGATKNPKQQNIEYDITINEDGKSTLILAYIKA